MWATDVVLSNCCFDSSSVKSDIIIESFNKKFKKGANGFRYLLLGQEKVFRCNTLL